MNELQQTSTIFGGNMPYIEEVRKLSGRSGISRAKVA